MDEDTFRKKLEALGQRRPEGTFKKSLAYRLERRIAYREGRNSVCEVGDEMLSPANRLLVADDDIKHFRALDRGRR
jgi:hypothetical protein